MRSLRIMRQARDAVIASHFHGASAPLNPHRKGSMSHLWWDMGVRKARNAIADLMQVGG